MKSNVDSIFDFFKDVNWITQDPDGDLWMWLQESKPKTFEFGGSGHWRAEIGSKSFCVSKGGIEVNWTTDDWRNMVAGKEEFQHDEYDFMKFEYTRNNDLSDTLFYKTECEYEEKVCIGSPYCEKRCSNFMGFYAGMVKCKKVKNV